MILMTMTEAIIDQPQRDQALRPDHSFIIQAPAGSGKTGLLIQRYLTLLSLVESPEEIIAITFTRKAAAEMRGRVLAALENAPGSYASEPENGHAEKTRMLAQAALKRDQQQGWKILENPGRLRIKTIDSLCASITRQMPMMSGLGTQPETLEDAEILYEKAAVNTLAELENDAVWSDSIARLVLYLDNDLPRIKKLIVDMLGKRDQWLAYVVRQHKRHAMEQSLADLIEEQLVLARGCLPADYRDELVSLLQFAAKHLLQTVPENPIVSCAGIKALPETAADQLSQWNGVSELLLTKAGSWRKQLTKKNGFPPASGNQQEADERSARKKQIQALITELQKVDGLQQALANIKQLPPANYTDDEWTIIEALCDLLKLAAAQLRLVFAEHNQMDFMGIADAAMIALGSDEEPTNLAMVLDYRIKHLLVDEYQDVSNSQYQLFKRLISEWSVDDGRSLFLVGDPMQSIYRFREAEVGLFIRNFHAACLGNVPLEPLRLQVNFRSQQPLVAWGNHSFKEIFPGQDNVISGAVSFSDAVAFDRSAAKDNVRVYPAYKYSLLEEAEKTRAIIGELKKQHSDDTIAILVRSRSHLFEIIPALRKAHLSFQAIDIEGLGTQAAIQDLLVLTRAYLFPADRVAWFACLRAPWCGVSVKTLLQMTDVGHHKTVWECLGHAELMEKLEKQERLRLERLKNIFADAFEQRQRLPLRQTIESLWCQLGGPATLDKETDLENCKAYFNLLARLDAGSSITVLKELEDQLGQLFATPEQTTDKPVQIMTMHKAKGLEFDHVILPGLGRSTRGKQNDLLACLLYPGKQHQKLVLAPIRKAGDKQVPIYDYINRMDKAKQTFENARLLYVASTRAKKTLHLMGHARLKDNQGELVCEPQGGSLLAHLWPVVKDSYIHSMPADIRQGDVEVAESISQENKRLIPDWRLPDAPPTIQSQDSIQDETEEQQQRIEFEWAGETIKHIGTVVHTAILWITEQGLGQWSADRIGLEQNTFARALRQRDVPEDKIDSATEQVQTALINMLDDERGRWILSKEHKQQQNEYPISGLYEGRLNTIVIDRSFIDNEGIRWIIDYKTSRHEGANKEKFLDHEQQRYQQQLKKYAALMSQLGHEKIKLGLYFPLLKGWREWDHD